MPLLFGVTAVPVKTAFEAETTRVTLAQPPAGSFVPARGASGYPIRDDSNSSLYALFALLKRGVRAFRVTGAGQEPDTIYLPQQNGLEVAIHDIATHLPVTIQPATAVLLTPRSW
ncbi:MAG: hypothetical protein ACRYGF_16225 [Janthinobacterium lividum]